MRINYRILFIYGEVGLRFIIDVQVVEMNSNFVLSDIRGKKLIM